MLASSQPGNALWQRDLVIAYIDYARVADNPKEVLTRALDITLDLQESGRLPPKYDYMVGALRKMLGKLGIAVSRSRSAAALLPRLNPLQTLEKRPRAPISQAYSDA